MQTLKHVKAVIVVLASVACAASRSGKQDISSHLALIYAADQADRAPDIWPAQWEAVSQRDSLRRIDVLTLLSSNPRLSSEDWYHAALIFQHGSDSSAFARANEWARRAVSSDSANMQARWLVAATWDRLQMATGKPQWYGTQSVMIGKTWQLYRLDSTKVTDSDRRALGLAPLDSLRAAVSRLNSRKPR